MPRLTPRATTRRWQRRARVPRRFISGMAGGASDGGAEIAQAGGGSRVTLAGGGWRIVCARDRAEVAPASDGRGGLRAHDVDGRRWVRVGRRGVHADGLEASTYSEGETLGSGVEGR